MSEKTPLLHYRLTTSGEPSDGSKRTGVGGGVHPGRSKDKPQKLGVLFGVVIPTLLSMFSVVVFLRIGEYQQEILKRLKNKVSTSTKMSPDSVQWIICSQISGFQSFMSDCRIWRYFTPHTNFFPISYGQLKMSLT